MRTLIWSKTFVRAYKRAIKKYPNLRRDIEQTLKSLTKDPFIPQLETHKLKGKLSGLWACGLGYASLVIECHCCNRKLKNSLEVSYQIRQ